MCLRRYMQVSKTSHLVATADVKQLVTPKSSQNVRPLAAKRSAARTQQKYSPRCSRQSWPTFAIAPILHYALPQQYQSPKNLIFKFFHCFTLFSLTGLSN